MAAICPGTKIRKKFDRQGCMGGRITRKMCKDFYEMAFGSGYHEQLGSDDINRLLENKAVSKANLTFWRERFSSLVNSYCSLHRVNMEEEMHFWKKQCLNTSALMKGFENDSGSISIDCCSSISNSSSLVSHQKREKGTKAAQNQCESDTCLNQVAFNFSDEIQGRFCLIDHLEGMEALNSNKCESEIGDLIKTFENFGIKNTKAGRKYSKHRSLEMVNQGEVWEQKQKGIQTSKCYHLNSKTCKAKSSGLVEKNTNAGGKCPKHRTSEIINQGKVWEQKRKGIQTCERNNCSACGLSNFHDEMAGRFCKHRRLNGMIKVQASLRKCVGEGCVNPPVYNLDGEPPKYCRLHARRGLVNRSHHWCDHQLQPVSTLP
mmetsp:Transcript_28380/g.36851  ORF Transcript_28380/g.36851 Transcript_28380/m.36851 type:complete len:375 (+) Transcript_28380:183-1307(+)